MGTEVQLKSYMPGYYSIRDLNEDANGYSNWPLHYRDRPFPDGQLYSNSPSSVTADSCIEYDKDAIKQKMLEHEAIFKKQACEHPRTSASQCHEDTTVLKLIKLLQEGEPEVYELHQLCRIQKDLMDEIRRKELASSPSVSRRFLPTDAQKLQSPGSFSNYGRPSDSGSEGSCYRMKPLTGHNSPQASPLQQQMENGCTSRMPDRLGSRPSKVRRRMFDLTLPAEKYIDPEESEPVNVEVHDRENNVVADLNQPIHIEDTKTHVHHWAHATFDGKILGKELPSKSQRGSISVNLSNRHIGSNGDGRAWISQFINAGHSRGDPKHAVQSKLHETTMQLPVRTRHQPIVSLASDWAKSNSHPLSDWEKPSGSFSQKLISLEAGPCPGSYSVHHTNFQPPPAIHGMHSERHQSGGRPDLGSGNKSLFSRNHFSMVSSSPGPIGITKHHYDQNNMDIKPSAAMNLNVLSNGESQKDHSVVLPWLRAKTSRKDETAAKTACNFEEKIPFQLPTDQLTGITELGACSSNTKILGIPIFGEPPVLKEEPSSLIGKFRCEVAETGKSMRMLDINLPCDEDLELSNSVPGELLVRENKEPCRKISGLKCEIDLNSCAIEDEIFISTADGAAGRKVSVVIDVEAPVFPEMEEENSAEVEKRVESPRCGIECKPDETIKIAAEAIVAISSTVPDVPEPSSPDKLKWFACIAVKERKVRGFCLSSEGMDYFESMTLKLTEMKDEEHLPQPLVPLDILKVTKEDPAAATSAANHRPQRRGRQRRDFQRDILPGLTSLSRYEMMEDMQTFGGLMRATGHPWNSRLTRRGSARSKPARPRRKRKATGCPSPPVPTPPCTPPVNLTGWGKTRRPRRQRCPVPVGNNPQLIQLT